MKYYLYILRCEDDYVYVGITYSLSKRLREHRIGLCKNTKNRGSIMLCYSEEFNSIGDAAKREKEIKGWRREKKEKLINSNIDACSE